MVLSTGETVTGHTWGRKGLYVRYTQHYEDGRSSGRIKYIRALKEHVSYEEYANRMHAIDEADRAGRVFRLLKAIAWKGTVRKGVMVGKAREDKEKALALLAVHDLTPHPLLFAEFLRFDPDTSEETTGMNLADIYLHIRRASKVKRNLT